MWSYGLDKIGGKSKLEKRRGEISGLKDLAKCTWGFLFLAAAKRDMVISDK